MGAVTKDLRAKLERSEERVTRWLVHRSVAILRIGLGCIFLGFGLLKFFPGLSPAEALVKETLDVLTFGLVPAGVGVVLLAALECAIGLGLITGRYPRLTLVLLGFQMIGAMSPLFLFPGGPFRRTFPRAHAGRPVRHQGRGADSSRPRDRRYRARRPPGLRARPPIRGLLEVRCGTHRKPSAFAPATGLIPG